MSQENKKLEPLVSIIIPVYNGANYMREAIDSALNQTYKNTEVIVINDGSKDNGTSEAIALSYANKIRYFNKQNGGVATALNLGIQEMQGEYFSWLSHDDIYPIDKIEKQIQFLNNFPHKAVVLYGSIQLINNYTEHIGKSILKLEKSEDFIFKHLFENSAVNGCTLLIPKFIFDDIGLFNPMLRSTQDYDMWFRIAQKYDFVCMEDILILSRQHEEQATNIPKPIVIKEVNELHFNMIQDLAEKKITTLKFKHKVFFYNYAIRILRKRKFLPQTVQKLEKILYQSIIDVIFFKKPMLFLSVLKCIYGYIYDYKILKT